MNPFDSTRSGVASLHPGDYRGSYHAQTERHDERGSHSGSGSDDGHYAPYSDTSKPEGDDDDNLSLTLQTLNADGTPKRPMNAFMIFARRRRPQVSSENQAMRTGEISKILSKEWNAMQPSEKQFYQDQAKQLKETFNSKYPDYVYRRRPNNSRKRRKTETASMKGDAAHAVDTDDATGFGDVGESPTSGDDVHGIDIGQELHHPRPSHQVSPLYGNPSKFNSSSSRASYGYGVADTAYRSNGVHDNRLAFQPSGGDRLASELPATSPLDSHITHPLHYSYVSQPSRSHGIYGSESVTTPEQWDSSVVRSSSWLTGGQDRTLTSLAGSKPQPYPSSAGSPAWHTPPADTPPATGVPGNYTLQTLNSPFYPVPPHGQSNMQGSPHPQMHVHSSYDQSQLQSAPMSGRNYDTDYATSPSTSPVEAYQSGAHRDSISYGQRVPSMGRLPAVSPYAPADQNQSPGNATPSYWQRD